MRLKELRERTEKAEGVLLREHAEIKRSVAVEMYSLHSGRRKKKQCLSVFENIQKVCLL